MSNQEITLWLNVAQICIVVVGGICIIRKINGKTCNPVKVIRQLIDDVKRAIDAEVDATMKDLEGDNSDRQRPNKDSSGDGG